MPLKDLQEILRKRGKIKEVSDLTGISQQIVIPGQSAKSRRSRYVPILPELAEILALLPPDRRGRLFSYDVSSGSIHHKWRAVCELAGVRRLKIHNLRDSFAVMLILMGVPLKIVSQILGHRKQETTEKYYAMIGDPEIQAVLATLPPLLPTHSLP